MRSRIFKEPQPRPIFPPPTEIIALEDLSPSGESYQLLEGFRAEVDATINAIDGAIVANALGKLMIPEEAFVQGRPTLAEDLPQEAAVLAKFYSFLGRPCVKQALEQSAEPEAGAGSKLTFAKSLIDAKNGDKEAEARVDITIATATTEAYFKVGHITRIKKSLNGAGEVVQFGLTAEQIQQDSIVHRPNRPQPLKQFTLAEVRNSLREQELAREGKLTDAWIITLSLVPQGMSEERLDHRGDGFFTRSMTYSLQGTTQEGAADIVTETVFDRGTAANERASYEERQNKRFDLPAIGMVCEWLGLPAPKTELEALQTQLYIPKHLMPNGMVDFWRWVTIAADTIMGEKKVRTV